MRWAGLVVRMRGGERRGALRFWCGNLMLRYHLEDLGVDGRMMLKWILKDSVGRVWVVFLWDRIGTGGTCEGSNEPSGSIKCREPSASLEDFFCMELLSESVTALRSFHLTITAWSLQFMRCYYTAKRNGQPIVLNPLKHEQRSMKVHFCPALPDIRKNIVFLGRHPVVAQLCFWYGSIED